MGSRAGLTGHPTPRNLTLTQMLDGLPIDFFHFSDFRWS